MSESTKELLNNMYWNEWLSTREIGRTIGKSQATVRKMMLHAGIPLRSSRDWLRAKIDPQMLETLYWGEKMTISQIAERFGVSGWVVHQRMIKFNIPRRRIGEANLKQPKLPFSGNPVEMAYLLGLRYGDVSARWKGKRVRAEVCTSHPGMIELFRSLFSKYSHVGMCPEYNKRTQIFMWRVFVNLDASFSFLVKKSKSIKDNILSRDDLFLAFLAGYGDAEGSIIVSPNRDRTVFIFKICSEDFGLLGGIRKKLLGMGYHPRLVLEAKKGTKKGFSELTADYWRLELARKDDAIRLIQRLPVKHSERVKKRNLVLEIINETHWPKVKDKVFSMKVGIKKEVEKCIQEAALEYHKKHTPPVPISKGNHEKTRKILEKTSRRKGSVHFVSQTLRHGPR